MLPLSRLWLNLWVLAEECYKSKIIDEKIMFLDWRPDIEKTMHTLETVLSYYHAAKDVEAIVKEGYVNIYL